MAEPGSNNASVKQLGQVDPSGPRSSGGHLFDRSLGKRRQEVVTLSAVFDREPNIARSLRAHGDGIGKLGRCPRIADLDFALALADHVVNTRFMIHDLFVDHQKVNLSASAS